MALNPGLAEAAAAVSRHARACCIPLGLLLLASCAQQDLRASSGDAMEPPVEVAVSGSVPGMSHETLVRIVDSGVARSERGGCGGAAHQLMQWSVLDDQPKVGIATATARLYQDGRLLRQFATRIHDPSSVSQATAVHDFAVISARLLECKPALAARDLSYGGSGG